MAPLTWLWSVAKYALMRYREGMLEHRGFQISSIKSSDYLRNDAFQSLGENVYSRFIVLTGQVEETWLKSPKRTIEAMSFQNPDPDGSLEAELEEGESLPASGIQIISKDSPEDADGDCPLWDTIDP